MLDEQKYESMYNKYTSSYFCSSASHPSQNKSLLWYLYIINIMKTLKFKPQLVEKILAGTKTSTWRLFDDKDIQVGDIIDVFNKDNGDQFGVVTITRVRVKTLGTLEESDWEGHDRYESDEAMYTEFRQYYGDSVGPDTEVKLIDFTFEEKRYNKIVVVDENDNVIGAEYMRIAVEKGLIRRASRVYVFNESG